MHSMRRNFECKEKNRKVVLPLRDLVVDLVVKHNVPGAHAVGAFAASLQTAGVAVVDAPSSSNLVLHALVERSELVLWQLARDLAGRRWLGLGLDGTSTWFHRSFLGIELYTVEDEVDDMTPPRAHFGELAEMIRGKTAVLQAAAVSDLFARIRARQAAMGMPPLQQTWLHLIREVAVDNEATNSGAVGGLVAVLSRMAREELEALAAKERADADAAAARHPAAAAAAAGPRAARQSAAAAAAGDAPAAAAAPRTRAHRAAARAESKPPPPADGAVAGSFTARLAVLVAIVFVGCALHVANLMARAFSKKLIALHELFGVDGVRLPIEQGSSTESFWHGFSRYHYKSTKFHPMYSAFMQHSELDDLERTRVGLSRWASRERHAFRILRNWDGELRYYDKFASTLPQPHQLLRSVFRDHGRAVRSVFEVMQVMALQFIDPLNQSSMRASPADHSRLVNRMARQARDALADDDELRRQLLWYLALVRREPGRLAAEVEYRRQHCDGARPRGDHIVDCKAAVAAVPPLPLAADEEVPDSTLAAVRCMYRAVLETLRAHCAADVADVLDADEERSGENGNDSDADGEGGGGRGAGSDGDDGDERKQQPVAAAAAAEAEENAAAMLLMRRNNLQLERDMSTLKRVLSKQHSTRGGVIDAWMRVNANPSVRLCNHTVPASAVHDLMAQARARIAAMPSQRQLAAVRTEVAAAAEADRRAAKQRAEEQQQRLREALLLRAGGQLSADEDDVLEAGKWLQPAQASAITKFGWTVSQIGDQLRLRCMEPDRIASTVAVLQQLWGGDLTKGTFVVSGTRAVLVDRLRRVLAVEAELASAAQQQPAASLPALVVAAVSRLRGTALFTVSADDGDDLGAGPVATDADADSAPADAAAGGVGGIGGSAGSRALAQAKLARKRKGKVRAVSAASADLTPPQSQRGGRRRKSSSFSAWDDGGSASGSHTSDSESDGVARGWRGSSGGKHDEYVPRGRSAVKSGKEAADSDGGVGPSLSPNPRRPKRQRLSSSKGEFALAQQLQDESDRLKVRATFCDSCAFCVCSHVVSSGRACIGARGAGGRVRSARGRRGGRGHGLPLQSRSRRAALVRRRPVIEGRQIERLWLCHGQQSRRRPRQPRRQVRRRRPCIRRTDAAGCWQRRRQRQREWEWEWERQRERQRQRQREREREQRQFRALVRSFVRRRQQCRCCCQAAAAGAAPGGR